MHKWPLKEISVDEDDQCLLQNDGFFLYLLCKDGLYKIGSGYSGTVRVGDSLQLLIIVEVMSNTELRSICFLLYF